MAPAPRTLPLQVAFLTGQSDPPGAALSPAQAAFLAALPVPAAWKVPVNFPYPACSPPFRPVALPRASWNNVRQFAASHGKAFAARHRAAVLGLLARAERTFLLAGSCGLHLLARLELPLPELARLHVFAYGAVAWRRPACDIRQVRGRRDRVARTLSRVALSGSDWWVEGSHLDYLRDPQVLALCSDYLRQALALPGIPEAPGATGSPGGSGNLRLSGGSRDPATPGTPDQPATRLAPAIQAPGRPGERPR